MTTLMPNPSFQSAIKVLPGGVSSPLRSFRKVEAAPFVATKGSKDMLWDTENKQYLDFCMGNGALIFGHSPSFFHSVFAECQQNGFLYGVTLDAEIKLAELIISHIPSIEKVRFFPSGTETTMTALRLARAYTKRSKIVKFAGAYHGHADSLLVQAGSEAKEKSPSSLGISPKMVEDTLVLPFNDEKALEELFSQEKEIAAVIIEPVCANMGLIPATFSFLQTLQKCCKEASSLLIFDEIVTGYRLGLQGAQGYYGITPDLTCLGKIIGGGAPCGALGGRKEILDYLAPVGPVFHAGTFAANPLAMRLGVATLQELEKPYFYESLQKKVDQFLNPIQKKLPDRHSLVKMGSMFSLFFGIQTPTQLSEVEKQDISLFKRCFHELFAKGIFLHPSYLETHFVSSAHTEEHLTYAQEVICDFIEKEA